MIPDFQTLMLPLLQNASDGHEQYIGDLIEKLAKQLNVSEEERSEMLDSGQQPRWDNRVHWAKSHLKAAGLIEPTRRGYFRITDSGKQLLARKPARVDIKLLNEYPNFQEFRRAKTKDEPKEEVEQTDEHETPDEAMEKAYRRLRSAVEADLLKRVKDNSPAFFERMVVELLVKMGYGGTLKDAGRAIGKSGDGGIDGIIKEDRLGLGVIYIQAKRWEGSVGSPEVQRFAGALQGRRAKRGVFMTTGSFSKAAQDYADNIDSRIALIDGPMLARLMFDHALGVSAVAAFEIKKVDSDYFDEE